MTVDDETGRSVPRGGPRAPGSAADQDVTAGRLNILHVTDHVKNVGSGLINAVVDLACAQAAAGHRVTIASGGGEYEALLAENGVSHQLLVREDSIPGRSRLVLRLLRIIRRTRPSVVNAQRPYATVAARLARPFGGYALVATDHNEFEGQGRYLSLADLIIAVSAGAANALAKTGVNPSRIRVVQNGPLYSARRSLMSDGATAQLAHPAIVTLAELTQRKGVHVLLDAFERLAETHPDVNLYFVGEGPERPALEARLSALRFADRVHLEGFEPDPGQYLRAADVFVLASFRDPFPLAALEARAAGCCVVVSNVDGLPEAVDHGDAGSIFPAGDSEALAALLRDLLSSDEAREQWRTRARDGLDRFSVDRMARDTEAIYREAIRMRGASRR